MVRAVLLPVAFCAALTLPVHAALNVSFTPRSVIARDVTPGAGAVFFSVGHEPHRAYFTIHRLARYVADEDRDGVVTIELDSDVPPKSVWYVADAASGAYVAATPGRFPQLLAAERFSLPRKDAAGQWTELLHERQWLELLVIGKAGIYELTAMRGGAADVEKRKGRRFGTPLTVFRPLTPHAPPLRHLVKGDTVIAIDPQFIEAFTLEVE